MKVYNFDPDGLLQGSSDAFPDPMKQGDFLLPAFSTFVAPPTGALSAGQRYKWNGTTWGTVTDPVWQADQDRAAAAAAAETDRLHMIDIETRNSKAVYFYDTANNNRVVNMSTWRSAQPDGNINEPFYNGLPLADPSNVGIQYVVKDQPPVQQNDLMTSLGGCKYRVNDNADIVLRADADVRADTMDLAWTTLRAQRDNRLNATDWLMLPDVPITPESKQAFIEYRQALRDLPANTTDPYNPVWPVAPVYA